MTLRNLTGALLLTLSTLTALGDAKPGTHTDADFGNYWYSDGAEISRYELTQARYGEIHKGDAILLFVTEKLLSDVQIKADDPNDADLPVLKLNAQRQFYTGIYPYSVMTSVFSPVDDAASANPVKITTSAQEWCSHIPCAYRAKSEHSRSPLSETTPIVLSTGKIPTPVFPLLGARC